MRIFFIIVVLFIFDFISKQIIFNLIDLNNFIKITFFFELAHIHNYGISFGLFSGRISPFLIILIGLLISFIVLSLILRSKNILEKSGYVIIFSGALSNIIDRAINGYVIDFIYLHYKDFYWPAFNFADIYISLGVLLILLQMFKDLRKRTIK